MKMRKLAWTAVVTVGLAGARFVSAELNVGVGFVDANVRAAPLVQEYNAVKEHLAALQKAGTETEQSAGEIGEAKKKLGAVMEQLKQVLNGTAVAGVAYNQAMEQFRKEKPQVLVCFSVFSPLPAEQKNAETFLLEKAKEQNIDLISVTSAMGIIGRNEMGGNNCLSLLALGGKDIAVKAAGVENSLGNMKRAGEELAGKVRLPETKMVLLLVDPALSHKQASGARVQDFLDGMREVLGDNVLILGGNASWGTKVRFNGVALSNGAVAIGLAGDLEVSANAVHGYVPAQTNFEGLKDLRVTKSTETRLFELNGQPVLDVFQAYFPAECNRESFSASPFHVDHPLLVCEDGYSLIRFSHGLCGDGGIEETEKLPEGKQVMVMTRDRRKMLAETEKEVGALVRRMKRPVKILLIFPCEARALFDQGTYKDEEFQAVRKTLENNLPAFGFFSCGEYGTLIPKEKKPVTRYFQLSVIVAVVG